MNFAKTAQEKMGIVANVNYVTENIVLRTLKKKGLGKSYTS